MASHPTTPPNILFVLADDLGYGDVSCLNPDSRIATPRLDRLAQQGRVFRDAHSSSAVCTPTRYATLTGRYCWRSRLKRGVLFGYSDPLIEEGRLTWPAMLKRAGYRTACIGKWHLGLGWQRRSGVERGNERVDASIDYAQPTTAGPHTVGFDESFILPASLDMPPYCYLHNGVVVEPPTATTAESPRPAFWREGPMAPGFEHQTCLLEFTRRAEAFIDHHAAANAAKSAGERQPFFLYFPTPSPHTPHCPRPPFVGASDVGPYGDLVAETDWSVGVLLDALDRNGLADNTIVVVTSDNGAHVRDGTFDIEQQFDHRSSYIFRGQKSDAWDGGHHVPMIARWTGNIAAGSTSDALVSLVDWYATTAALVGQPLPEDAAEDSFDLRDAFFGNATSPDGGRRTLIHTSIHGEHALRDGRWKLVACKGSGGWSKGGDEADMQLYDLASDPQESANLIDGERERATAMVEQLRGIKDAGRSRDVAGT